MLDVGLYRLAELLAELSSKAWVCSKLDVESIALVAPPS